MRSMTAEFNLRRWFVALRPHTSRREQHPVSAAARTDSPQLCLLEASDVCVVAHEHLLPVPAALRASAVVFVKVCILASRQLRRPPPADQGPP